ncbi:hypothetical protein ACFQZJ_05225 [Maribacter chungangensis]|uniref:DUF2157 domain-containing protein n=1 Tax=Maribacter chungangensis TaxID=1069117 RepID=A0ABW3B155_9FLAO
MDKEDRLMEILREIDAVNGPIDLENAVLKAIMEQEHSKQKIANYKAKGMKALTVSVILIIALGILFSMSGYVRTVEHSIITYTSIIIVLIVLFIQLEMGGTNIFKNHKNIT